MKLPTNTGQDLRRGKDGNKGGTINRGRSDSRGRSRSSGRAPAYAKVILHLDSQQNKQSQEVMVEDKDTKVNMVDDIERIEQDRSLDVIQEDKNVGDYTIHLEDTIR